MKNRDDLEKNLLNSYTQGILYLSSEEAKYMLVDFSSISFLEKIEETPFHKTFKAWDNVSENLITVKSVKVFGKIKLDLKNFVDIAIELEINNRLAQEELFFKIVNFSFDFWREQIIILTETGDCSLFDIYKERRVLNKNTLAYQESELLSNNIFEPLFFFSLI